MDTALGPQEMRTVLRLAGYKIHTFSFGNGARQFTPHNGPVEDVWVQEKLPKHVLFDHAELPMPTIIAKMFNLFLELQKCTK